MRTDTQNILLQTAAETAFSFLSRPENLPKWARAFARSIAPRGDGWVVSSPQGEVGVRYVTEPRYGIVDYHLSLPGGGTTIAHSRVLPLDGACLYVFTQSQPPQMPDEAFAAQVEALGRELRLLKGLLEVGSCG